MASFSVITRIKTTFQSRAMRAWLVLCWSMVLGSYGLIGWVIFPARNEIFVFPFHYTIYFGIDRVGPWYSTFTPAVFATLILVMNIILLSFISEKDKLVSRVIAIVTIVLLGLTTTGSVLVALINLS